MKEKSRSPPKLSNGRLPLILACLPCTCKNTDSQGCEALILPFMAIVVIGIYLGFKREFSKLIGFLVVALIAVGLVFNAGGVKDVLLELFNKIIGA